MGAKARESDGIGPCDGLPSGQWNICFEKPRARKRSGEGRSATLSRTSSEHGGATSGCGKCGGCGSPGCGQMQNVEALFASDPGAEAAVKAQAGSGRPQAADRRS